MSEFVPDLCQTTADLDVLPDLGRRRNNKLRGISGSRGTDSVPGHHIISKHLGIFRCRSYAAVAAPEAGANAASRSKSSADWLAIGLSARPRA